MENRPKLERSRIGRSLWSLRAAGPASERHHAVAAVGVGNYCKRGDRHQESV